jgi:hypothetical protein
VFPISDSINTYLAARSAFDNFAVCASIRMYDHFYDVSKRMETSGVVLLYNNIINVSFYFRLMCVNSRFLQAAHM